MKKSKLLVTAALAATILGSQAALADNHEEAKKQGQGKNGCQGKNTCKGQDASKATKEAAVAKDGSNGCGANGCQAAHKTEEQKKK